MMVLLLRAESFENTADGERLTVNQVPSGKGLTTPQNMYPDLG